MLSCASMWWRTRLSLPIWLGTIENIVHAEGLQHLKDYTTRHCHWQSPQRLFTLLAPVCSSIDPSLERDC